MFFLRGGEQQESKADWQSDHAKKICTIYIYIHVYREWSSCVTLCIFIGQRLSEYCCREKSCTGPAGWPTRCRTSTVVYACSAQPLRLSTAVPWHQSTFCELHELKSLRQVNSQRVKSRQNCPTCCKNRGRLNVELLATPRGKATCGRQHPPQLQNTRQVYTNDRCCHRVWMRRTIAPHSPSCLFKVNIFEVPPSYEVPHTWSSPHL